jgi:hypothetical protein
MLTRKTTLSAGQKHEDADMMARYVEGMERCAREREADAFKRRAKC